ncbi:hypothetical protein C8Q79DRAFT_61021 [Trametes meyenii]|nr:hypothetical protein C8Q79DRAFT_61021 [Trametes meyenii]
MPESAQRPVLHYHECSHCRKIMTRETIKMCAGCKVMGYCSKECQKSDWKFHKTICNKSPDGTPAPSRDPAIKVAEKIANDDEVMGRIDGIIIKALDLENHPERAETHAVVLSCRVESTDMEMAKERLQYLMSGREPPPLPEKIPKLFQIGKVAVIEGDAIPESLTFTAEGTKKLLRAQGYLEPGSGQSVVRAMWVSEFSQWTTFYFARPILPEMIQEAAVWKKPLKKNEPPTDKLASTEDLIELFNVGAVLVPEFRKKLTIMVSTRT